MRITSRVASCGNILIEVDRSSTLCNMSPQLSTHVVICATTLFNLPCNIVAPQVERKCSPCYASLIHFVTINNYWIWWLLLSAKLKVKQIEALKILAVMQKPNPAKCCTLLKCSLTSFALNDIKGNRFNYNIYSVAFSLTWWSFSCLLC